MPGLTEKVSTLANKMGILEITIASGEGLPITSTARDGDKESADGVYEIQQRLLKSGMEYLTFVDKRGMKILYHDDKFYYIVRSQKLIDGNIIWKFRQLVDVEIEEREREREKRELEAKKIKEEREKRELEVKKIKEEREKRELEAKKKKEEREKRELEAKKKKEEREKRRRKR